MAAEQGSQQSATPPSALVAVNSGASGKAGRLDSFVAPRPNRLLIALMVPVNRIVMLHGLPVLRDIPVLNRVPGIRGIANVRHIDFPKADQDRLAAVCGEGNATFLAPNHPEFFTDWMIDKEISSRVAPLCASWATNGVVNGLGALAQRFWLANNLIAQIPGNSGPARAHSVGWALQGKGVLLHPEGAVGWHGDFVAPLMPGAAEMAVDALGRVADAAEKRRVWIAPIVWKLVFTHDVEARLAAECTYVEQRLHLGKPESGASPAERVFRIYEALLSRDEQKAGVTPPAGRRFAQRLAALVDAVSARLSEKLPPAMDDDDDVIRRGRRWLREEGRDADPAIQEIRAGVATLQRLLRLGDFAWQDETMTQEHVAEHIKRIRNDHCKGTLRDTMNAFLPQPAGPRRAHIRVADPLLMNDFSGSPEDAMQEIRRHMQAALDGINAALGAQGKFRTYPNPFYTR